MQVHKIEKNKIPITILTGFLGSGKTTLLNYILTEKHGYRIAVIENEFGEVDVDSDLVLASEEEIYQMQNGCICCFVDVRNDLIDVMNKLLKQKDKFDHIIVETSGLADPTPVATAFFADRGVAEEVNLDAIVTLVDAKHIDQHLYDPVLDGRDNQAVDQIVAADRIIVNKVDLACDEGLSKLESELRNLNQTAPILRSRYGVVDLGSILNINGFQPSYLRERAEILQIDLDGDDHHDHHHHGHLHDETVSSVSFTFGQPFVLEKLQAMLTGYLEERGAAIFRTKGILSIAGEDRFFVLQAVHQLFDLRPDSPWRAEQRLSKIVFIGRDLDREELAAKLSACLID
ncbi:CobW family GTP-binding protein [Roseibium salinum]|uniref:GTP-binding protein n=1 Tax=Roseibium salinum TaxID=1604349 RepID=A0ABT3QZI7_9HYPH|nr:GTP-binding protein [Roseibium sp. DSM 29163]MCX2722347.1 GTP-binding protein [Roseibium sp. DSM 29163]